MFSIGVNFNGGTLVLGGMDPALLPSSIIGASYTATDELSHLRVNLLQIGVGSADQYQLGNALLLASGLNVMHDSGNLMLSFAPQLYSSAVSNLQRFCGSIGSNRLLCQSKTVFNIPQTSCLYFDQSDVLSLPSFWLRLGRPDGSPYTLEIPPNQWIAYRPTGASDPTDMPYCGSSKISAGQDTILGTPFYRSVQIVVDNDAGLTAFYPNPGAKTMKPRGTPGGTSTGASGPTAPLPSLGLRQDPIAVVLLSAFLLYMSLWTL